MPALQAERGQRPLRRGGRRRQGRACRIEPAAITGLIGPNGAGKTTIFNVFGGLQPPTEGRVLLDGQDITRVKAHARARQGHGPHLPAPGGLRDSLSVRDNIRVAAEIRKAWARDRSRPADGGRRAPRPHRPSRRGRVACRRRTDRHGPPGRAGAGPRHPAALLLLDEPGSGLDQQETTVLGDLLVDLAAEGMAMLLVEHDVELVMRVCDRVHVLDFGRLIAEGTPAEVQSRPRRAGRLPRAGDEARRHRRGPRGGAGRQLTAPALELRDVRAAYGRIEVVHGVDLVVPRRRCSPSSAPTGRARRRSSRWPAARWNPPPAACTSPGSTSTARRPRPSPVTACAPSPRGAACSPTSP